MLKSIGWDSDDAITLHIVTIATLGHTVMTVILDIIVVFVTIAGFVIPFVAPITSFVMMMS
jgi:hypothetical protein